MESAMKTTGFEDGLSGAGVNVEVLSNPNRFYFQA